MNPVAVDGNSLAITWRCDLGSCPHLDCPHSDCRLSDGITRCDWASRHVAAAQVSIMGLNFGDAELVRDTSLASSDLTSRSVKFGCRFFL